MPRRRPVAVLRRVLEAGPTATTVLPDTDTTSGASPCDRIADDERSPGCTNSGSSTLIVALIDLSEARTTHDLLDMLVHKAACRWPADLVAVGPRSAATGRRPEDLHRGSLEANRDALVAISAVSLRRGGADGSSKPSGSSVILDRDSLFPTGGASKELSCQALDTLSLRPAGIDRQPASVDVHVVLYVRRAAVSVSLPPSSPSPLRFIRQGGPSDERSRKTIPLPDPSDEQDVGTGPPTSRGEPMSAGAPPSSRDDVSRARGADAVGEPVTGRGGPRQEMFRRQSRDKDFVDPLPPQPTGHDIGAHRAGVNAVAGYRLKLVLEDLGEQESGERYELERLQDDAREHVRGQRFRLGDQVLDQLFSELRYSEAVTRSALQASHEVWRDDQWRLHAAVSAVFLSRTKAAAVVEDARRCGGHRFVRRLELLVAGEATARRDLETRELERRVGLDERVVEEALRDLVRGDARYTDAVRQTVEQERDARSALDATASRKWNMLSRLTAEGAARLRGEAAAD